MNEGGFWYVIGGMGVAIGTGFMYLLGLISQTKDVVAQNRSDTLKDAIIDAQTFVTKADLDRLETRLNESMRAMLREHETNVRADIDRRERRQ